MSDVSKLEIDGIAYDIKDATARKSSGINKRILTYNELVDNNNLSNYCSETQYNVFTFESGSNDVDYIYLILDGSNMTDNMCGVIYIDYDTYNDVLGGGWVSLYRNGETLNGVITSTNSQSGKPFHVCWFFGKKCFWTTLYQ